MSLMKESKINPGLWVAKAHGRNDIIRLEVRCTVKSMPKLMEVHVEVCAILPLQVNRN